MTTLRSATSPLLPAICLSRHLQPLVPTHYWENMVSFIFDEVTQFFYPRTHIIMYFCTATPQSATSPLLPTLWLIRHLGPLAQTHYYLLLYLSSLSREFPIEGSKGEYIFSFYSSTTFPCFVNLSFSNKFYPVYSAACLFSLPKGNENPRLPPSLRIALKRLQRQVCFYIIFTPPFPCFLTVSFTKFLSLP